MERFLSHVTGKTFPWPYWSPFDEILKTIQKNCFKKKFNFFFSFFFCQIAAVNFEACIAFLSGVTGKTFPWSPFDNFFKHFQFFFFQFFGVFFLSNCSYKFCNMERFFSHATWKGFSCHADPLINLYGMKLHSFVLDICTSR
jgi:hypothetical protein